METAITFQKDKSAELNQQMRNSPSSNLLWWDNEDEPILSLVIFLLDEGKNQLTDLPDDDLLLLLEEVESNIMWKGKIKEEKLRARDQESLRLLALFFLIKHLGSLNNDIHQYLDEECPNCLVFSKYPELKEYHDKKGLLDTNTPGLNLRDDNIGYKNHFLHYHPFLRENFMKVTPEFVEYKKSHPTHKAKIAVAHDRLGSKGFSLIEKDFWRGPRFCWEDVDDRNKVGVTIHGQTKPAIFDELWMTEFRWTYDDGQDQKTLEIEELVKERADGKPVINRYIHSIRDLRTRRFIHLDGAVKIYKPETYAKRVDPKVREHPNSDYYKKLFRIDIDAETTDRIDENEWSNLVACFFKQNELVLEYLGKPLE